MAAKPLKSWVVASSMLLTLGYCAHTLAQFDIIKLIKTLKPVSQKNEIKIGRGIAAKLVGVAPLVGDEELQAYINKIGKWLALQTKKPGLPWRFGVLDTESVNAFAVPGGYVFVTRGLLLLMRDESELAGVLAHEISHVIQRHAMKTMRKGELMELGGQALNVIAEGKGSGGDFNKVVNIGTELYSRGLDKKDEFAADQCGAVIAARSGYDPYGMAAVLQTLASINPKDDAVALMFKTHPDPSNRMERVSDFIEAELERYADPFNGADRFAQVVKTHAASYTPAARAAAKRTPAEEKQDELIRTLTPLLSQ